MKIEITYWKGQRRAFIERLKPDPKHPKESIHVSHATVIHKSDGHFYSYIVRQIRAGHDVSVTTKA